jgi:hypothetical protein
MVAKIELVRLPSQAAIPSQESDRSDFFLSSQHLGATNKVTSLVCRSGHGDRHQIKPKHFLTDQPGVPRRFTLTVEAIP